MEIIWIIIFVQAIVFGSFSSFIAKEKKRDPINWFLLGFLFSLLAILALLAIPSLDNSGYRKRPNETFTFVLNKSTILWVTILLIGLIMLLAQRTC